MHRSGCFPSAGQVGNAQTKKRCAEVLDVHKQKLPETVMNKKYLIEAIIFFSYLTFAMSWVGASTFMQDIMKQVNIHSLVQASILSTAVTIAKIVGTAIAATIVGGIGLRRAVLLAGLLVCFGIFTPIVTNFQLLIASRFLMGLGGALMIVYFNPIVVSWFAPSERPAVNGLNNITFNLGAVLTMFLLQPAVSVLGSWGRVLTTISVASTVLTFLWLIFGQAGPKTAEAPVNDEHYPIGRGMRDPFTWTLALIYSGMLSFYIVMFTFYPAAGINETHTVLLSGLVGGVAGMVFASRVRNRIRLLRVSGAFQVFFACLLSFATTPSIVFLSAVCLGIFLILPLATVFTLGQDQPGMTRARVSVRFSIFWSASYVIATLATTIFAWLVDLYHGNFHAAFAFICCVEGFFLLGSLVLKDGRQPGHLRLETAA
jgi:CP family cyanate transporter-like MFS transporter